MPLSLVAALATSRASSLTLHHEPIEPLKTTPAVPAGIARTRAVRDGEWRKTLDETRATADRVLTEMKTRLAATETRRPNASAEQWDHHLNILARQAVEMIFPAALAPWTRISCLGRPSTVWTTLYRHPLTEVRKLAAGLRELPADRESRTPGGRRTPPPRLPWNFDEARAVDSLAQAARNAAAEIDRAIGETRARTTPAVYVIDIDESLDRTVATAAAYEHGERPYELMERELAQDAHKDAADAIVHEAAESRRWPEQPPDRALGAVRAMLEITCSALSWRALAHVASKAGATVLLQGAGACGGFHPVPEAVRSAGFAGEWTARMSAHTELYERMREEGVAAPARQYAITSGHFCRGVVAATGDRLVRIMDWLLMQRGPGAQSMELLRIGHHLITHLGNAGPKTQHAVFQPRERAVETPDART